ncbi:hypothetical protein [Actinomyces sp. oral taxon 897]|uniref:hypothetical protein n=1 Tax=Actinomyces sp. oral taxon 897 TaxID=2081702 RepID=UPI00101AEB85|nr:hypothetical protein [Actinomyces sp. oral taxon 897]
MTTTTASPTPPSPTQPTTPALRPPVGTREQDLAEKARKALEARRLGAELRRGRRKSFQPVVGRI